MIDFIVSMARTDERLPYAVVERVCGDAIVYDVFDAMGVVHQTFTRRTCGTDNDAKANAYGMVDALNNEPYAD